MKFDFNTKKPLDENLTEIVKVLIDAVPTIDDYDAIILGTLIIQYINADIGLMDWIVDTPDINNIQKFGINEIARLVKKEMAYKTTITHTQKLIKEGYLIDINQLIIKKIEDFSTTVEDEDSISNRIALTLIQEKLEILKEKYKKTKRMLIVNFDKL